MERVNKESNKYPPFYFNRGSLRRSFLRRHQRYFGYKKSAAISSFLVLLLLTSLPSLGHTALRPPSTNPEYRLQVSFDLPRKKIKGQVVIQAPPGQKLVIDPGDLSLTNLEVGGRRVAISRGQEGELLVLFPPCLQWAARLRA
jgi:hypothetical protein